MKAVVVQSLDGPDGLAVVATLTPTVGPGEVLVAVEACALNFMDTLITRGRYQIKPELPFSPSAEFAGRITAIGDGVAGFDVGDRVAAYVGYGAAREVLAVAADRLIRVPDSVATDVASGLIVTYGTALYAFRTRLRLGQAKLAGDADEPPPTVAVLGASGGAGLAAVEVAKALGATVIAVASSLERVDIAKAHGADLGLVYGEAGDLKADLRSACAGDGPDIVYDCVGGPHAEPALRALAAGGAYVVVGFAAGDIPSLPANIILLKDCTVHGIHWGASIEADPGPHRENLAWLMQRIVDGRITPRAPKVFPFEQAADALREIGERRAIGKIVLTP